MASQTKWLSNNVRYYKTPISPHTNYITESCTILKQILIHTYDVLGYCVLYCVMYWVIACYIVLCNGLLRVILCYVMGYCVMYWVIACYIVLCNGLLRVILCYVLGYCVVMGYCVLYCVM